MKLFNKSEPILESFFFDDLTCGMCYRLDLDLNLLPVRRSGSKSFIGAAYRTVPAYFHHCIFIRRTSVLHIVFVFGLRPLG